MKKVPQPCDPFAPKPSGTIEVSHPRPTATSISVDGSQANEPGDKSVTFSIFGGDGYPSVHMRLSPAEARRFSEALAWFADRACGSLS